MAGYPEAHPDTIVEDPVQMEKNYWENIQYLKQKAGLTGVDRGLAALDLAWLGLVGTWGTADATSVASISS